MIANSLHPDSPSYDYPKSLAYSERLIRRGYPIPPSTPDVLAFYMNIMGSMKFTINAPGPRMALGPSEPLIRVTLQFAPHRYRRGELLRDAMKFAIEAKPGRMGEFRDRSPVADMNLMGFMFVNLWVRQQSAWDEEQIREELPIYASEEEDTEEEPPPPYDEGVVREPVWPSPFGASPFQTSPFGASFHNASSFGASPFGASPFMTSPFQRSPFRSPPFGTSPFRRSPYGTSPFD